MKHIEPEHDACLIKVSMIGHGDPWGPKCIQMSQQHKHSHRIRRTGTVYLPTFTYHKNEQFSSLKSAACFHSSVC